MNSNECKLKIKICYKGKQFETESEDIIPLQKIKEISIEKFDIIKEDEKFINFEYHSNKENKNHPIENEDNIIRYADEDNSGNLFCNLELVINNPKSNLKVSKLSNEIKGEKIENKKPSVIDINKITDKVKTDIKQDEKENNINEINKLKLDIENIKKRFNFELTNLQKENSEKEQKVKDSKNLINNLKENIKKKENEITIINSEINKLRKENEIEKNQKNNFINKYIQSSNNLNEFIEKTNKCYNNLLKVKSTFEGIIEEMKLKIDIVNEYKNEKNENNVKKKDMEENENIELIKNVIEQMKIYQNNEVIEENKKLKEENSKLKIQLEEINNEKNKFDVLTGMFENLKKENQEIKQIIYYIAEKTEEKNILINENEPQGKKDKKGHKENKGNKENKDKKEQKEQKDKNRILSIFDRIKKVNKEIDKNPSNNTKNEINSSKPKMSKENNNNNMINKKEKNKYY